MLTTAEEVRQLGAHLRGRWTHIDTIVGGSETIADHDAAAILYQVAPLFDACPENIGPAEFVHRLLNCWKSR